MENNELLQTIYIQVGCILVIQILEFAIDYVVKPLSLSLLMLKLEAIVRRSADKKMPEDRI